MLKFSPIIIALIYGFIMYRFSAWKTGQDLSRKSTVLADRGIRKLTDQMAAALDLPKIRVHVYEIPQMNGLAAPDGRIFITRGFLEKYRLGEVSDRELAGVVAHELGHVALGHSRRRMIDFSGQNAARVAMMMVLNRFVPGIGGYIANFLTTLLMARISRNDEYEADAYASALLIKSGIGTGPQKSLFQKLDKLAGGGSGTPAWMLSHPKTSERIAAIELLEVKWNRVRN
jgi:putative metalloprotease